jgi:hypothetical protein
MHAKLIALLFLLGALAVLGQEGPKPATYTRDLEQEPVRARA